MRYFRVKNFEQFQRYKDREPTWIMLHRSLLRDYEFAALSDAAKCHLILIWLLMSQQKDRLLPYDPKWIGRQIQAEEPVNLETLVNAGFLLLDPPADHPDPPPDHLDTDSYQDGTDSDHSRDLSLSLPSASVSGSGSPASRRRKAPEYTPGFLAFWAIPYPRPDGKQEASRAWARLSPTERELAMADVPRRVAANWAGRPMDKIPHASTYLNQKRWEEELIPASATLPGAAAVDPPSSPGMNYLKQRYREEKEREDEQKRNPANPGSSQSGVASAARR